MCKEGSCGTRERCQACLSPAMTVVLKLRCASLQPRYLLKMQNPGSYLRDADFADLGEAREFIFWASMIK